MIHHLSILLLLAPFLSSPMELQKEACKDLANKLHANVFMGQADEVIALLTLHDHRAPALLDCRTSPKCLLHTALLRGNLPLATTLLALMKSSIQHDRLSDLLWKWDEPLLFLMVDRKDRQAIQFLLDSMEEAGEEWRAIEFGGQTAVKYARRTGALEMGRFLAEIGCIDSPPRSISSSSTSTSGSSSDTSASNSASTTPRNGSGNVSIKKSSSGSLRNRSGSGRLLLNIDLRFRSRSKSITSPRSSSSSRPSSISRPSSPNRSADESSDTDSNELSLTPRSSAEQLTPSRSNDFVKFSPRRLTPKMLTRNRSKSLKSSKESEQDSPRVFTPRIIDSDEPVRKEYPRQSTPRIIDPVEPAGSGNSSDGPKLVIDRVTGEADTGELKKIPSFTLSLDKL